MEEDILKLEKLEELKRATEAKLLKKKVRKFLKSVERFRFT